MLFWLHGGQHQATLANRARGDKNLANKISGALLLLLLGFSSIVTWASTPPSPVNQNLGIPDSIFNNMTTDVCGSCHFSPDSSSAPVKQGYLPDRHHLHVGRPIGKYSASPFPEKSPDGTHSCTTCHALDWIEDPARPSGGYFAFSPEPGTPAFRNCLNCHQQKPGVASVHHLTAKAQAAECNACHGSLIDDPNEKPWQLKVISHMSPNPGFGDGDFGLTGHRQGGCRYCHNGGTDDASGLLVPGPNANMMTHHGTGLGQPGSGSVHTCSLCHDATPPNHTLQGCVRCHAPTSLHSIQADSDGNGTAGSYEEQPFFGHIGTSSDCMGCHMGGSAAAASVMAASTENRPLFGPLLPEIHQTNIAKVAAGTSPLLLLTGAGYLVATADNNIATRIVLHHTNSEQPPLELVPESVTFTTMEVRIPPTLVPGNYSVNAVNGAMASVPVNLVVTPAVTVDSVSCSHGTVTITGSGFNSYLDADGSGTGVTDIGAAKQCDIQTWTDTSIVADCGATVDDAVRVDSVFGSATASVVGCKSPSGRPRWWEIWSWWSSWSWSRR